MPVSVTGAGVVQFGTETRMVFSHVTGAYTDFPQNLTTVINTNVVSYTKDIVFHNSLRTNCLSVAFCFSDTKAFTDRRLA